MNRIWILKETLEIANEGKYVVNGRNVRLTHPISELMQAIFISEKDVQNIIYEQKLSRRKLATEDSTLIKVTNRDSFSAALNMSRHAHENEIAVLNFANPVNPGGGVRYGTVAQEEDLCRKSTLLVSLESKDAEDYYKFHKEQCDCFSSHSIIISPYVEVFRSYNNDLLPYTFQVSVLTCSAPIVDGVKSRRYTHTEYTTLLSDRITGILSVCAKMGFKKLVLGAWGCGSFGNDPMLVSRLFEKNIYYFEGVFEEIEFAVLGSDENYNCFYKAFVLKEFE